MPTVIGKRDISDKEYRYIYEHVEVWQIDQDTGEIILTEVGEDCNWGEQHCGMVNTNYNASDIAGPKEKESDKAATSSFVAFGSYRKQPPQEVDCGSVYFLNTNTIMSAEVPSSDPYDADSSVASSDGDPPAKRPSMFETLGKLPVAASASSFVSYREDASQEVEHPRPHFPKCEVVKSKGLPSVKFYGDSSSVADCQPPISSLQLAHSAEPSDGTGTVATSTSSFISYCDHEQSRQETDPGEMRFLKRNAVVPKEQAKSDEHKPTPVPRAKPTLVTSLLEPTPKTPTNTPAPSFVSYCEQPRQSINRGQAFFPPQDPIKSTRREPTFKLKLYFTGSKLSARA